MEVHKGTLFSQTKWLQESLFSRSVTWERLSSCPDQVSPDLEILGAFSLKLELELGNPGRRGNVDWPPYLRNEEMKTQGVKQSFKVNNVWDFSWALTFWKVLFNLIGGDT